MGNSPIVLCLILLLTAGLLTHVGGSATLEPSISASVNEGGELQVCVSLDPPATGITVVSVATSVETATGDVDFTPLDEDIMFTLGETRRCTASNISIPMDNIVESVETFNIRISSNDVPISPLSTIATRVNIADLSRITIAFTASEYTTPNENDAFNEVCATITDGEIDRDVTFSITSVSAGTAIPLDDFNIIPASVMPPRFSPDPANNNPCIQINLVNDNLVEQDEYFIVQLSGGNEAIDVLASTAQVTITDDDGATVQLSQTSTSVPEGNSGNTTVNMCLDLTDDMGGLQRDVVVNITTQDRTALASDNDYFPILNQPLTIPSSTLVGGQVCTPVVIIGDEVRELSELFQVIFTAADDNDVVPAVFRITIADDGDVLVTCPALNNPQNGQVMVDDVNNIQGANASYSCSVGFELIGDSMRVCQNTGGSIGVWSGSDPTCQSIDCGLPPQPANAIVQSTTTTFGSTAVYSCDPGYELSTGTPTFTRHCLGTAEWSEVTPSCDIVDCGQPPITANGQVSAPTTTFQSMATYTCNMGYEFPSGDQQIIRMCQADSTWSDSAPLCQLVDCGQPPSATNGQVSAPMTTFQSTATYTCNMGYEFGSGDQQINRTCQANMEWSDSTPECQPVNCGPPPNTANGQVNATTTTLNSVATYQCDSGYEFDSGSFTEVRTCQPDGTWSDPTPACNAVDCGQPPVVSGGQVIVMATTFQSTATYECNRGFEFPSGGSSSIECQADRSWSTPAPTCQQILCEELSNPENGTVSLPPERIVDSIATYACNDSFELVGAVSVICQLNGTWSAEEPTCIVVCEDLSLNNGIVEQSNGSRLGSVATHSCSEGFMLSGEATRTCQSNGEWTGSRLSCMQNPTVPPTVGLRGSNTDSVVTGASIAGGIVIFILILAGGVMCLACIVIRKKKVYKKYVLPYRTYMYANSSVRSNHDGITPDNDIRQWENDTQTHALAAVEALDK